MKLGQILLCAVCTNIFCMLSFPNPSEQNLPGKAPRPPRPVVSSSIPQFPQTIAHQEQPRDGRFRRLETDTTTIRGTVTANEIYADHMTVTQTTYENLDVLQTLTTKNLLVTNGAKITGPLDMAGNPINGISTAYAQEFIGTALANAPAAVLTGQNSTQASPLRLLGVSHAFSPTDTIMTLDLSGNVINSGISLGNLGTSGNVPGVLVQRDFIDGGFAAGTITANLVGYHTGNVSGDVNGNVSGAASQNVLKSGDTMTGTLRIANAVAPALQLQTNAVALPSDYVLAIDSSGSGSVTQSSVLIGSLGVGTSSNVPDTLVLRDSFGNFAATTMTAALTGDVTGSVNGHVIGNLLGNVTGTVVGNLFGDVTGNLSGNVVGGLFGDVSGAVVGNLFGNVTGNVTGNLVGNVLGTVIGSVVGNVSGAASANVLKTGDLMSGQLRISDLSDASLVATGQATTQAPALRLFNNPMATASDTVLTIDASGNVTQSTVTAGVLSATSGNVPNTLVLRDGAGTFATSAITLAGGSTGFAALHQAGNQNTGFYFPAANQLALVAGGDQKLMVNSTGVGIGTSDPFTQLTVGGALLLQGSIGTAGGPAQLVVQGRSAYVVTSVASSLQIIDVSNQNSPTLLGELSLASNPVAIHVNGTLAYTAADSGSFQIIDVSNQSGPHLLSTLTGLGSLRALFVQGAYAYVMGNNGQDFLVIDVSNPAAPVQVGTIGGFTDLTTVYAQGRYAYLTDSGDGKVYVVDVNNPQAPRVIAFVATGIGTQPQSLDVQGRYAYVVCAGDDTFRTVDVSNPSIPLIVGTLSIPGGAQEPWDVFVEGRYAYIVAKGSNLLYSIDVSDPTAPFIVGSIGTGGVDPRSLFVQGRSAYVADMSDNRLQVIDLGGAYIQQLEAGGLEVGTLAIRSDAAITGELDIHGEALIGRGFLASGDVAIEGKITTTSGMRLYDTTNGAYVVLNAPTTVTTSYTLTLPGEATSAFSADQALAQSATLGQLTWLPATSGAVPTSLVMRDSSGNFFANTITASLIGDVTGTVLGDMQGNVTGTVVGNLLGDVTGTVVGNLSGAASANILKTGDTMTGTLRIAHAVAPALQLKTNAVALAADTLLAIDSSGNVTNTMRAVGTLVAGTSTNIPNTLVSRDSFGNFAAGTITANVIGNVTGNVTGDVVGNLLGNVTGNVVGNVMGDLTGNVAGNVVGSVFGNVTGNVVGNLLGDVTGNVVGDLSGAASANVLKTGDTMTGTLRILNASAPALQLLTNSPASEQDYLLAIDSSGNVTQTATPLGVITAGTSTNIPNTLVLRDSSGNFAAGTITSNLIGNVTGNVTGNVVGNLLGNVTGNVVGNVLGDLTGNVTGDLVGNVFGNVTGNVVGNLLGDVTGNVVGDLSGAASANVLKTGDTMTGTLRIVNASAPALQLLTNSPASPQDYLLAIDSSGNVTQTATPLGVITAGTSTNIPNTLVVRDSFGNFAASTITSNLIGNVTGNVTGDVVGNLLGNVTGNVVGNVMGDLTGNVTGDLVGNVLGNVTGNVVGNLLGDVTGNVVGDLSGAASANVLKIGDTMTGTLRILNASAPALQLLTNSPASAQDYLLAIDSSGNVTKTTSPLGVITAGTSTNISNTLVLRDSSGNFASGTITSNLIGNVTGNVTGDVVGNLLGNVTGNVVGNVLGDLTGNVTGNLVGNVMGNVTGNVVGNLLGDVTGNVVGDLSGAASANVLKIGDTMTGQLRIATGSAEPAVVIAGQSTTQAPALRLLQNPTATTLDNFLAIDNFGNVTNATASLAVLTGATSSNVPNTLALRDDTGSFAANMLTLNGLDVVGTSTFADQAYTPFATVSPQNILYVKKGLLTAPNQFSSIKSALTAITDASATNLYVISVAPGVYAEANPLTLKSYVSIVGCGEGAVVIQAGDQTQDLFVAPTFAPFLTETFIQQVTLGGATGANKATIALTGGELIMHNVDFSSSDKLIKIDNSSGENAVVRVIVSELLDTAITTTAFDIQSMTVGKTAGVIVSQFTSGAPTTNSTVAAVRGVGSFFFAGSLNEGSLSVAPAANSRFLYMTDGAHVQIGTASVNGYNRAFECAAGINGSFITLSGVVLANNTSDIVVDDPQIQGSITGQFSSHKATINPAVTQLSVLVTEQTNGGGLTTLAPFTLGRTLDVATNVAPALNDGTSLGVLQGGLLSTTPASLVVTVSAGSGYLMQTTAGVDNLKLVSWATTTTTVVPNTDNFISINNVGLAQVSLTQPSVFYTIPLGKVRTGGTGALFVQEMAEDAAHTATKLNDAFVAAMGPMYVSGSIVTTASIDTLSVSGGQYVFGNHAFAPLGKSPLTWQAYLGGAANSFVTTQASVDYQQYDLNGVLTPIPANYYARHGLYVIGGIDSVSGATAEQYALVYSQTVYASLPFAEVGDLPVKPATWTGNIVPIASVIVKNDGAVRIAEILDERPRPGFVTNSIAGVTVHGNLLGLLADDHPQYLLVNGTRALSGSLQMGGNNITNVTTVNGVVVESHAARHLPNGADPLATGVPVDVSILPNDAGSAPSFSRSDHSHFHGNLAGGLEHSTATVSSAGFMSSADFLTLVNATSANTATALVKYDSSGNFSAGTITAGLVGNVTGNVTGNVLGQVTGSLLGNVTGNIVGNLLGNVTGNVVGNVSGAASANVLKIGDTMTGQLRISDPSLASLMVTGQSTATAPALRLFGNPTAQITDNFLTIDSSGNVGETTAQIGVLANATSSNVATTLVQRDSAGNFAASTITAGLIGNVTGNVSGQVTGSLLGNVTGNVVGNLLGNVTGNVVGNVSGAASANVLKVGDTMTGQLRISDPSLASLAVTGQSTTTAPALRLVGNPTSQTTDKFLTIDSSGNVSQTTTSLSSLTNATSANVANTLVQRDSAGNFAASTITAGLIGNVTGNVTGQVTGSLIGTVTGNVVGNLLGNVTGNVVGNVSGAASANVLKIGDTMTGQLRINDLTLASLVVTGHSTTTAPALRLLGNLTAQTTDNFLTIDGSGNVDQTTVQIGALTNATSSNVANTLVLRDNSGNFATSAITLNAGITGATSINFAGSAGTGLYSPGANQLALVANNAQQLYANNTGVGIGTSAPFTQLTVGGTALLAGSTGTGTGPTSVYVQGRYAYVANYGGGSGTTMSILDVSNASSPVVVGTATTGTGPYSVYVQGRYAYVTNRSGGTMSIIDVSNASGPVIVGSATTGTGPISVYVQGRYAYVVNNGNSTMSIIDVSNPSSPITVGTVATGTSPYSVYVQGRYAYVTNASVNSMSIIDVSNPSSPVSVGAVTTGLNPRSVYVQGRYTYVANLTGNSMSIVDVSNPGSPVVVGTVAVGSQPSSVYVQGRYAYVANYGGGGGTTMSIIDVSNPGSPVVVGTATTGTGPFSVYVQGRYAYVVNAVNSLQIIDLGGAYIQQLEAGGIESGTLATRENLAVGNDLDVRGGAVIGRTLHVNGDAAFDGRVTVTSDILFYDAAGGQYVGLKAPTTVNTSYTLTLPTDQGTAANQVLAQSSTLGQLTWLSATSANAANTLVLRDSNNNFTAGAITASLVGNVTGNVSGNLLGNVTGNVVGNVSGAASANVLKIGDTMTGQLRISDPSLASLAVTGHSTTTAPALRLFGNPTSQTTDNFLTIDGSGNVGQTTVQIGALANATSSNVANALVQRDSNGNFAASTITAGLIGNVTGNVTGNVVGSLLGNVTGNVVGNLLGNVTGNVVGNVSGAASANVLKIGDTMTGQLRISDPSLASLIITGHSTATAPALRLFGNPTSQTTDNFLTIDGSGNVDQTTIPVSTLTNATSSNVANTLVLRDNSGNFATSAITLNAGTTGATSINFAGSVGTGLYSPGTNQLALVANNAQQLYANSTGVGIGTSAPFTQLTVGGTAVLAGSTGTGTGPQSVYVQGRYAYVANYGGGSGTTMSIIDVSNASSPVVVGTATTGVGPVSVYVQGRYAYVANYGGGSGTTMSIIDVSNASSPIVVGTATTGGGPISVYVQGRYAYVVNFGVGGGTTMSIIDISNPRSPIVVGTATTGGGPYSVYVQGRYAYVANRSGGTMSIIDVSNVSAPVKVVDVTTGTNPVSVYVQGRYAYVANYGGGSGTTMSIIDVSNVSAPVAVGTATTGAGPASVYVQGRYAYVANTGTTSMSIIDVSNPSSPITARTVGTGTNPTSVYVQGRYAYVASYGTNKLQIFDLDGAYIQQLEAGGIESGTLATRENVAVGNDLDVRGGAVIGRGLQVTGDVALDGKVTITSTLQLLGNASAASTDSILTINGSGNVTQSSAQIGPLLNATSGNVANALVLRDGSGNFAAGTILANQFGIGTTAPFAQLTIGISGALSGSTGTGSSPFSIYVQGRYAYVANSSSNSMWVIDVSNSSSPVVVGTVATGSSPVSVYVQGRYAYVVNANSNSMWVIDVSNPSSPVVVGTVTTGTNPYSVYVQGRYAYVANVTSNSMWVIDVSNPSSPVVVGTIATASPRSVYVQGRYAYVANYTGNSMSVIDVSNPSNPVVVGSVPTAGQPVSVYVQGRYAYMANNAGNSMSVIDVKNPSSPVVVGTVATGTDPYSVYVQGRYAYVANYTGNSLSIIDVSNPSSPIPVRAVTMTSTFSVYIQGRYAYVINQSTKKLQIIDLGGAYIQQLEAGGIESGTLATRENVAIGNDLDVKGGAVIGRNLEVQGQITAINASGSSGTATTAPLKLVNVPTAGTSDGFLMIDSSGNITKSSVFDTTATSANVANTRVLRDGSGNFATSAITLNAGTTGAPAINFAGSAGTGLYSPGTNQLALTVNNAQKLYANSTGVGVGTSSPFTQLTVGGSASLVGSVGSGTIPVSAYVQGRYAYVANYSGNSMSIIDVSNPSSPVLVGTVTTGTGPISVYVQGRYAYVANYSGNSMWIFDVSNPSSPVLVGTVATGTNPYSVYTQGRYAYVVNSNSNSMWVIDVSNPSSPVVVGTVTTGTLPYSVYVQGRYAYVANYSGNSMWIIDVSNPSNPVLVGTVATGSNPNSVYVQGRYAYVANYSGNSMSIIDVSNPSSPIAVGAATTGTGPISVYVQGRYAYVVNNGAASMSIIDVSNPSNPVTVGIVATGANPQSVYVQGRYAYVASVGLNSLQVFDLGGAYIQQLEAGGIETGTLATRENVAVGNDLDVKGGTVFGRGFEAMGSSSILGDVVVTNTNISLVSTTTWLNVNILLSADVQGRYVYAVDRGTTTMRIFDYSNPASPSLVGVTAALTGTMDSIVVKGRYAYVGTSVALYIFDISNPASPTQMSMTASIFLNRAKNAYVQGRYYYVGDETSSSGGMQIIDVSNPAAPVSVGTATGNGNYYVTVDRNYFYGATNSFNIYDVTNPTKPTLMSTTSLTYLTQTATTNGMYIQGRYAYLSTMYPNNSTPSTGVVWIFDISNPVTPVMTAQIVIPLSGASGAFMGNTFVQGKYLYVGVAAPYNQILIYDVSNPASPVMVGASSISSTYGARFKVQGRYLYVANSSPANTLQIYDLGGTYIQQLEAGGIESGTLATRENVAIGNDLDVRGGVVVGRNLAVNGQITAINATGSGTGSAQTSPLRLVNVPTGTFGSALSVDVNGNVGIQTSSRRFKENIVPLTNESDLLYTLTPVTYDFKPEYGGGKGMLGFIAEDIAQAYPTIINYDSEGLIRNYNSSHLHALTINEVQKHKKKLDTHRATLGALLQTDSSLQADLTLHERMVQEVLITLASMQAEVADLKNR